jgi:hypothetical protein
VIAASRSGEPHRLLVQQDVFGSDCPEDRLGDTRHGAHSHGQHRVIEASVPGWHARLPP